MASVVIGGVAYTVTLPNFKRIKAAWPHIRVVQDSADPMESVDGILALIAAVGSPPATLDALEEALTPDEMPGLTPFLTAIMMEMAPGEAKPSQSPESPSTATSTD